MFVLERLRTSLHSVLDGLGDDLPAFDDDPPEHVAELRTGDVLLRHE